MNKPTRLNNVISFFSPSLALRRQASLNAYQALRKFDAATAGRRASGWEATGTSVNTETLLSLRILRDRSRDMVRNNPYAKNAVDVITTNTIGTGLRANPTGENDAQTKQVTQLWKDFAETTECDFNGQMNFYGLESLVMRTVAESGECLIIKRPLGSKSKNAVPFQLQVVEPDFIDLSRDNPVLQNGGYIQQGIEFDKNGKRVGYYLYPRHPGESFSHTIVSTFVKASEVLHVYRIERPGQIRGIPFGVSAMMRLKDFDDYEDAELMRQKIAACFAVFITDSGANSLGGAKPNDKLPERVEPGIIERLPAGKTVTFGAPPVTTGYAEYSKKILQAIAIGYGVTYEALTSDLSNVNFSSGRMGWLEFHRRIVHWQDNILIPMFCNGVFEWFKEYLQILGAKGKFKTIWTAPRREMIDPVKETEAFQLAIRNGLMSWSEVVRMLGSDPETVLQQIIDERKKFKAAGVILDCDPEMTVPPQKTTLPTVK
jgi:lambda family phage portal protein